MRHISEQYLIWCGPGKAPLGSLKKYRRVITLDTYPGKDNVHLKFENISAKLARDLPSIAWDMLEIGMYVYSADQTVKRGGDAGRGDGKDWYRNFVFEIPVRNPGLWARPAVKDALAETLGFLSDDHYEFTFRELTREIPHDSYFDFDEGQPWFDADEVLLFSGGLDSLAGAIEEVVNLKKKVVLVGHRPVAKISKRQRDLLKHLTDRVRAHGRFLHVPVWGNKDKGLTRDTNQRTRSFLYTMLGATVAFMHKIDRIRFYENGIVSINLPFSAQLVGALASRSTHPKVLHCLSKLLTNLLGREITVENPFLWKTKSDIVEIINKAGLVELIQISNSCASVRTTDILNTHCGVCSQCIERKLATLYNKISDNDPAEMYKTELFLDPIEKPKDRTMVESYVKHAMSLADISPEDFFQRFGEANRVLQYVGLPTSEAAEKVLELYRRHGKQACQVVKNQIQQHAGLIARRMLRPKSLLAMLVGEQGKPESMVTDALIFPTPEGTRWEDISIEIISLDSARIRVKDITLVFTTLDMGFRDRRKRDLPNKQWDLLLKFAERSGVVSWVTPKAETGIYKGVQLLKATLCRFFQLTEPPIEKYKRGIGYVTKFAIKDSSYRKS